jgi:hypothetical protein
MLTVCPKGQRNIHLRLRPAGLDLQRPYLRSFYLSSEKDLCVSPPHWLPSAWRHYGSSLRLPTKYAAPILIFDRRAQVHNKFADWKLTHYPGVRILRGIPSRSGEFNMLKISKKDCGKAEGAATRARLAGRQAVGEPSAFYFLGEAPH